jgi:glycosyltransferase involved in cell wall biosynthesis
MLSVLIPTYNYDVYKLTEVIHAQCERTDILFEIVVIDDGSVDFKAKNKLINKLSHATYICLERNIGRTAVRGKLADTANYEWLLFLDSDVLPTQNTFIQNYIKAIEKTTKDVVFGGIVYQDNKPSDNLILRWHYGREREAKSAAQREKSPYFIISQNLLIKKQIFLAANTIQENFYGLDNFFSNQLKRQNAKVGHIDNPVIHLGLEANSAFVAKALKAVETTVRFEQKGLMDTAERPLQKSYLKLKNIGLTKLFKFIISKCKARMERNFLSAKPNLFWFDLYRLAYYIDLKNEKDA